MKILQTAIPDVLVIEPTVFSDARGYFFESFHQRRFEQLTGVAASFVQDNQSRSVQYVLRGLHYQVRQPQGKLVRVLAGEVFDVCVDLRRSSPTFAKAVCVTLSADSHRQLWVPPGFAHGFVVTSAYADVAYKTTDYYAPEHERSLLWNDPALGIPWPLDGEPLLSARDQAGIPLAQAETYA